MSDRLPSPPVAARRVRHHLHRWSERRAALLFGALMLLIALGPSIGDQFLRELVWEGLITLVLVTAVALLSVSRRQTSIAILFATPTLTALWLNPLVDGIWISQLGVALLGVFILYATGMLLAHVFRTPTVTMDTLLAAFCAYLLIGFLWGAIYAAIYLNEPGSFHLPYPRHSAIAGGGLGTDVPLAAMFYLSFLTLTTVGGDVLPLAPSARAAVIVESVLGQFYVTILVARLIGLYVVSLRRE